ncbi:hypothetical protein Mapa_009238 [Marchantia paleacea]|nr:hypothetical protein Mapa_009238 [Marchantia paleacea]
MCMVLLQYVQRGSNVPPLRMAPVPMIGKESDRSTILQRYVEAHQDMWFTYDHGYFGLRSVVLTRSQGVATEILATQYQMIPPRQQMSASPISTIVRTVPSMVVDDSDGRAEISLFGKSGRVRSFWLDSALGQISVYLKCILLF